MNNVVIVSKRIEILEDIKSVYIRISGHFTVKNVIRDSEMVAVLGDMKSVFIGVP